MKLKKKNCLRACFVHQRTRFLDRRRAGGARCPPPPGSIGGPVMADNKEPWRSALLDPCRFGRQRAHSLRRRPVGRGAGWWLGRATLLGMSDVQIVSPDGVAAQFGRFERQSNAVRPTGEGRRQHVVVVWNPHHGRESSPDARVRRWSWGGGGSFVIKKKARQDGPHVAARACARSRSSAMRCWRNSRYRRASG